MNYDKIADEVIRNLGDSKSTAVLNLSDFDCNIYELQDFRTVLGNKLVKKFGEGKVRMSSLVMSDLGRHLYCSFDGTETYRDLRGSNFLYPITTSMLKRYTIRAVERNPTRRTPTTTPTPEPS